MICVFTMRPATSKVDQLANTNAISGSFGYRGEALSSISDVSLLEVITKARGRPNGYRKGCKFLYLGIDDGRQDVGTTVIVRDLFYNQPVRRKHIQSSPKKLLHSVKKCILRIAIVHPKVFFEVVDIESEDELFCTTPSSSPLSLLTSGFGFEISSSLHELNVSDGVLKLSGYMSSPCDTSFVKACQFVCIHEVEYLVSVQRFKSSDLQEANMKLQNGKRKHNNAKICKVFGKLSRENSLTMIKIFAQNFSRVYRILTVKKQWLGYRKPSYRGVYIETQLPKPIYKGFYIYIYFPSFCQFWMIGVVSSSMNPIVPLFRNPIVENLMLCRSRERERENLMLQDNIHVHKCSFPCRLEKEREGSCCEKKSREVYNECLCTAFWNNNML
ncbi:hypothetical protein ACSBR1_025210 [Camellia fascicularis]